MTNECKIYVERRFTKSDADALERNTRYNHKKIMLDIIRKEEYTPKCVAEVKDGKLIMFPIAMLYGMTETSFKETFYSNEWDIFVDGDETKELSPDEMDELFKLEVVWKKSSIFGDKSKCCFCGDDLNGRGNSTWGCWSPLEERILNAGERRRCCDKCNLDIVVPQRLEELNTL